MNLQTRDDFRDLLFELINPLLPCFSPGKARLRLGHTAAVYDEDAAELEGFSRMLWGLVPFFDGGGSHPEFERICLSGLAAGTDPESPEYWGGFQDVDQRFVEMAAIAFGILAAPEKLWDPLSRREKENLAAWLNGINHHACPPCNWMFFGILVNIALKSVGFPYSEKVLKEYLDYIESCYLGGGWYLDGQNGERDYYVSFAFHYYGLMYSRFMKKEDLARCRVYEERAKEFAGDFLFWFAEDGSALAFGRSLTYRFAQAAFFSMCAACGLEVVPFPVMKGIIVRHLAFWMDKPIRDLAGLLTIGYGYPNLLMSEQYNAPGSPYWALKTFAVLSLPADHPFWQLPAAPLPDLPALKAMPEAGMLLQRANGHVTAYVEGRKLPHHHVHTEEKYSKFAYSSRFAFSVPRSMNSLEEAAPDSMLAFQLGRRIFTKGMGENICLEPDSISMDWSPWDGIQVHTRILPTASGHRRIHTITSRFACQAWDCGFAFPATYQFGLQGQNAVWIQGPDAAWKATCVRGDGVAMTIQASPNTNLMSPKTVIPCIRYEIREGTQVVETEFEEMRQADGV